MKVSACFATLNEIETVKKAWPDAKDPGVDEWLVSDNGSTDGVDDYIREIVKPDVFIKFKTNTGIAISHNPLFAMASGDLIVLTGCNRIPPVGWVQLFKSHFEAFPDLVACCTFNQNITVSERTWGSPRHSKGLTIVPGCLMDVICFKRELFRAVGYYQTCFGLWGVEDIELTSRIQRYCRQNKKLAGFIPGYSNLHMGFDPREPHDSRTSTKEYYELKKAENEKFSEKEKKFNELGDRGFPYFSPY